MDASTNKSVESFAIGDKVEFKPTNGNITSSAVVTEVNKKGGYSVQIVEITSGNNSWFENGGSYMASWIELKRLPA